MELAGNGLLDDVPGKTTGEERAEIAQRCPTRRRRSSEATALFDDVWYGDAPTGPSETERLRSLSDAVLEKGCAMKRNTIVFWLVLAVGLVLVALAAGAPPNDGTPLDPRGDGAARREGARADTRRARR